MENYLLAMAKKERQIEMLKMENFVLAMAEKDAEIDRLRQTIREQNALLDSYFDQINRIRNEQNFPGRTQGVGKEL